MGLGIHREHFTAEDRERFSERLLECLDACARLLGRSGFGDGERSLGAELELFLVDGEERPLPVCPQVLAQTNDERLTPEVDLFQLECNLRPGPLTGRPFSALRQECESALAEVSRAVAPQGGRYVLTGTLPTLREEDLDSRMMTQTPRYRVLSATFHQRRRQPRLCFAREESVTVPYHDVTVGGAATSMQYHLRVSPAEFAAAYNAAQLVTAPVLALAANAPILLERSVWDESRIPLLQQYGDAPTDPLQFPRVSFGHGWVRRGALELFAEAVALHAPVLPELHPELPRSELFELRLHQSTVWTWNRAIFDPSHGGHLRIELRALPAGPTVVDMMANGALLLGLTLGLRRTVEALLPGLPFEHAKENLLRAARDGLDAVLLWPETSAPSPRAVPVVELLETLLPVARAGLLDGGVDPVEADLFLGIVAERVRTRQTGARWQRAQLKRLEVRLPRREALAAMMARYRTHSGSGTPVHDWPLD